MKLQSSLSFIHCFSLFSLLFFSYLFFPPPISYLTSLFCSFSNLLYLSIVISSFVFSSIHLFYHLVFFLALPLLTSLIFHLSLYIDESLYYHLIFCLLFHTSILPFVFFFVFSPLTFTNSLNSHITFCHVSFLSPRFYHISIFQFFFSVDSLFCHLALSAGAVEYTDCTSTEA